MPNELRKLQDLTDFDEKFRSMCLYYTELLAKEGVRVRPFRSPELPVFSKLKDSEKQSAIAQVSTVLEVFEEVLAKDGSLKDSNKLVWRALAKLGWVPSSDIFSHMEDGDIICFHDAGQRMVFQSLTFFDWVSYTLEDLYGGLWYTHSKRDDQVAQKVYEFAVEMFSGAYQESVEPNVPEHVMHEVDTEEMLKFWIKIKRACPLKSNGQITGLLLINRCRWVEESMSSALKKVQDLTDYNEKFRQMCLYYSDLLALEGKKVKPFRSPDLPVFSTLTEEQKKSAIDFIGTALEIFEETRAEGFKLNDSPKLLWRALRKLGWTPQSDVFDRIGDKDVVNIYTPQNIQIFQNLNFFDWVTLSLEELYGAPWHVYSRREAKCAELAYQSAVELFTGARTTTFSPDIPEHYVEEIGTEEPSRFYIKIHTASPLRQNGQIMGLLAVNRCREWDGVPYTGALL